MRNGVFFLSWQHYYNEDDIAATIKLLSPSHQMSQRVICSLTPVLLRVKEDANLAPAFALCSRLFCCTKPRWNRLTN